MIELSAAGGVAVLQLNDSARCNALSPVMPEAFVAAFGALPRDTRAVVWAGI